MQTEFFTIAELAERFRCTPITLRRWIAAGVFPPPLRIGRRKVLWLKSDIEMFERMAAEVARKKAADDLQFLVPQSGETAKA